MKKNATTEGNHREKCFVQGVACGSFVSKARSGNLERNRLQACRLAIGRSVIIVLVRDGHWL